VSTSQVISSRDATVGEGRLRRYTFIERVHHWLGSITYVYCLITGLAFWSPYMYWLAAVVGGGPTARFWHPWFGLAFAGSMIWMFVMWDRDMRITDADRRWAKAMDRYVENDDARVPPSGRFNYGQKLFFWLMFYGVILLVVCGIDSVEPALAAVHGSYGSRDRGARYHRRLYYSCLYEHGPGPRQLQRDGAGRRVYCLGEGASSPLVRTGHRGSNRQAGLALSRSASLVVVQFFANFAEFLCVLRGQKL
jgi:thiosulfate reductase cytochrome b subunit